MNQEDKELLLKDLCARLPYGVKGKTLGSKTCTLSFIGNDGNITADTYHCWISSKQFVPYLRPMSSMTKEEKEELSHYDNSIQRSDFYYSHHLDCRYLIEKELALEAFEGMYEV